jgi:hypothetical protein
VVGVRAHKACQYGNDLGNGTISALGLYCFHLDQPRIGDLGFEGTFSPQKKCLIAILNALRSSIVELISFSLNVWLLF